MDLTILFVVVLLLVAIPLRNQRRKRWHDRRD